MRAVAFLLLILLSAAPVAASEYERPIAQIGLVRLPGDGNEALEAVIKGFWRDYYQKDGEYGFTLADVLTSRFDLDRDGQEELIVMIDKESWGNGQGKPFLVAQWRRDRWRVLGSGWSDEDSTFVTAEKLSGWHTLSTPRSLLRFVSGRYHTVDYQ